MDVLIKSIYFGVALSFSSYGFGKYLQRKLKLAIFNPMLIAILCIIGVLKIGNIEYEVYNEGAKYITFFLTPATICLAVPLYKQVQVLKQNVAAILYGVGVGCICCMVVIFGLAFACKLNPELYASILPKSVTTAIAIGISEEIGGISSVTVMTVVFTGIFGSMTASKVFSLFHIEEPVAQGLACGTAAHVIGTAKATELGEVQEALSSLAIITAGVMTVILAPIFSKILM